MRDKLVAYYTRYYRDALGVPAWRALVAARLDEEAAEVGHLARVESALGRAVRGLRVLNVGCGTGGFSVTCRRAGARVFDVDTEWAAVEICRLKAEQRGPGVVALAAAEALPYREESFDLVYCFSTLEHVSSVPAATREMLRVLRSGGALYLHSPSALGCYEAHYKLFWLPGMPRRLARWYLRLRGRPTGFLDTLTPLRPGRVERLFTETGARVTRLPRGAARLRESGGPLWPAVRAYYRLFGVDPYIELVVRK